MDLNLERFGRCMFAINSDVVRLLRVLGDGRQAECLYLVVINLCRSNKVTNGVQISSKSTSVLTYNFVTDVCALVNFAEHSKLAANRCAFLDQHHIE
jgi:hypothetical protein